MIFRRLTLEDFGVYSGKQSLNLDSEVEGAPITLVGGQNGEGKTTLLEAILHVLYGPHAGSIIGRAGGYDRYLRSTINHRADSSRGASIELELETIRDGTDIEISVRRSWQVQQDQVREQLTVSLDGRHDRALTEGWADYVETLIPRGVAPLFFFDGEQIEALADLDGAASTIRAAVGSLLGLDLVDQLRTDLLAIQRRHAPAAVSDEVRKELELAEAGALEAEKSTLELKERLAAGRSKLDQAENDLRRAVDRFRKEGGELYETRVEVESEVAKAHTQVKEARERLREIAGGNAPLLLAGEGISRLLALSLSEEEQELASRVSDALDERDRKLVSWTESFDSFSFSSQLEEWLAEDRSARMVSGNEPIVEIDRAGLRSLETLVVSGLDQTVAEIQETLANLEEVKSTSEQTERKLAQVPSSEAIAAAIEDRDEKLAVREKLQAFMEVLTSEQEFAFRERERRYVQRDRVLRKVAELEIAEGDSKRLMEHSIKARETLEALREAAVAKHMARIEQLIIESLEELLRKDRLIEKVRIDPISYQLELFGPDDRRIASNDLSAGERQLTALSLLWGLARAADRPLPLIIDTPLGRLDASHRNLLLTRYLPKASHQIIVLSTDTEVDAKALALIEDSVGRSYRLEHSDEKQGTEIVPGYLFDDLAMVA